LSRSVPADNAEGRTLRDTERHIRECREGLVRPQIAQDASLKQGALERGELPAAVATIDLRHVGELDRVDASDHLTPPPQTNRAGDRTANNRRETAAPTARRAPGATSNGRSGHRRKESPDTTPPGA